MTFGLPHYIILFPKIQNIKQERKGFTITILNYVTRWNLLTELATEIFLSLPFYVFVLVRRWGWAGIERNAQ